jgi:hypothetical protein
LHRRPKQYDRPLPRTLLWRCRLSLGNFTVYVGAANEGKRREGQRQQAQVGVRQQKDADDNEDDSNGKAQAQEDTGVRVLPPSDQELFEYRTLRNGVLI